MEYDQNRGQRKTNYTCDKAIRCHMIYQIQQMLKKFIKTLQKMPLEVYLVLIQFKLKLIVAFCIS